MTGVAAGASTAGAPARDGWRGDALPLLVGLALLIVISLVYLMRRARLL